MAKPLSRSRARAQRATALLLPLLGVCLPCARGAAQHQEQPSDPPAPATRRPPGRPGPDGRIGPTIVRGPFVSYQVNIDAAGNNIGGDAANEPSIAVDPTDPRRIVIGWRQFDAIASNFRQNGVAYSHDGGHSWTFPGAIEPGVFNSDPVVDTDAQGNFYYLSYPGSTTLKVFRSANAGQNWSLRATTVGGDKAWMLVDRTGSTGRGNIYVIWQVIHGPNTFIRSTDGGLSFGSALAVPSTPTFGTLAVDTAGTLYAAGLQGQTRSAFVLARSTDARDPLSTPTFQTVPVNMGGSMVLSAAPNPGGLLGQAQVAADPTRPGQVYMLCSVNPPGSDPMDVHVARSTDGGRTFGAPVRINDDPVGTDAWQWFGTLAVAPNGRIDVVWNDTRFSGASNLSETCYAFSPDGGQTWSKNVPVNPRWDSLLGHPNQNKIGDYYDMVSNDATARLAYSATFNGEQDVYFLELGDCNDNGVHDSTDVQNGTSFDSNANTIPDECEFCQQDLGSGAGLGLLVCGDDLTTAGSRATIQVEGGPAQAPVFLLLSPQRLSPPLPLPGGAGLVPDPTTGFGIDVLSTNSRGKLGVPIRGGARSPFPVWLQAAMLDAQNRLLVSNAVEVRIGT